TTILEAIHSFSPDVETSELVGGEENSGVPYRERVPRHLISNFSGDVSVMATVRLSEREVEDIISELKRENGLKVQPSSLPKDITIERQQKFKNGDFVKSFFTLRAPIRVKTGKQRNWRVPNSSERCIIRDAIYNRTPDIAYFPTFVFEFPKRIFLTEGRGDKLSNFYRAVFQDILDYDGKGHTIENSIVRRVRAEEKQVSWLDFINIWSAGDDRDKIQHVMDRASAAVTDVVFGRWNKIFDEDVKGKEINISFETTEGELHDQSGSVIKTNAHDLFIKFQIKDGTRRFSVNDRSLGFRWFFAFMLFTQFRVAREGSRPILFLFDEPASNLHAAAQQKLIDTFPAIAKGDHTLAYSTHSHYMIEPKWLEQTFIVTNRADTPTESVIDSLSLSDESLDIRATKYNVFVDNHPSQTSYFQPILDRLNVLPSRFDIDKLSIIVEGKSDYYVLRYGSKLVGRAELPLMPAIGAGTFNALISLHLGWGVKMLVLLDGDRQGKQEQERYQREFGIDPGCTTTLDQLLPGCYEIENLLDETAKKSIRSELNLDTDPSKKQILRFFQESLARDDVIPLGDAFADRMRKIVGGIEDRLPIDNKSADSPNEKG
ncbi:MAG TPA: AAA family ATPase, partial [Oleiagrimonas sp.]|nr:AAA family ATPase [Oleiagrimonas sp.]